MLNKELHLNSKVLSENSVGSYPLEKKSTRSGFGDGIVIAGANDENVVVLTGDLKESTKVDKFAQKYPNRFIEVGIAEQNMAGISAGLALNGKIPFMCSFSSFSPGRNWEQIRDSICYSEANVKLVGTHSGLTPATDGPTAQALEDISTTRVIPNLTVINPIDYHQALKATLEAKDHKGPVYLRLAREETPQITTDKTPFKIGDAYTLIYGEDLTIITTGQITVEVIKAARNLESKFGVKSEVLAVPTIKPLDKEAILKSVKKTKKVVTVEEHQIYGGLGSAVSEVLSQNFPVKTLIIGVEDTFCESATYQELLNKYGLAAHHIETKVINFLKVSA